MKTLPNVASEIALSMLAYNLTRVMNIVGIKSLMATLQARRAIRGRAFCFPKQGRR